MVRPLKCDITKATKAHNAAGSLGTKDSTNAAPATKVAAHKVNMGVIARVSILSL